MPKFVTFLTFLVPIAVFAAGMVPKEILGITDQFNRTMMTCPQKIWTDYSWEGLKVVFLYPSGPTSWIWDASTNTTQEISNNTLPRSAIGSAYCFFELLGRQTMSLNMESDIKEIFLLGVHEFFHHHGQKGWQDQHGGRGTVYPLSWQPRFYRRMIFDNLKMYLESDQKDYLRRARYWFDKWSIEYPDESQATTDGYEGTAEYVETLSAVLAETGCAVSDEQLKQRVVTQVKVDFGHSVDGHDLALDLEGYEIGGLSALILRFKNGNLGAWNKRVSQGKTPLQVLLEPVSPLGENVPQALQLTFVTTAQRINAEQGALLDEDITNWPDRSYVRIPAPYNWLQSNLRPRFFAHASHIKMDLFPLAYDHRYLSPKPGSDFELKANTVIFDHYTTACSNQHSFALLPASSLNFVNGMAIVSTPSVTGKLTGELKYDELGYQYLCLE